MFIGHYALALAARPSLSKPGLGSLFLAVSWADLVWPLFLLLGWEQVRIAPGITARTPLDFTSYPWSHSLLLDLGWGLGLAFLLGRAWSLREKAWFAALVVSHWVLDWLTHRPDLPLWPGSPRFGLGLWNHIPATALVEGALFVAGLAWYLRASRASTFRGHVSLWSFVAVLVSIYTADTLAGQPPPNERVLAWAALVGWLPVPWGLWIERTRTLQ